jgi:hypothetical protein
MYITQAWEECHSCTIFKMFGKTKRRRQQILEKELRINEEMPTTKTLGEPKLHNWEIHTQTHTHTHTRVSVSH